MRGLALVLFVAGCESDPEDMDMMTMDCTGAEDFALGMQAISDDGLVVTLESAEPAPVDVGDNAWTLSVSDDQGEPVTGLAPQVRPFMPLHGHGLSPTHYAGTEAEEGMYEFETFDLIMPGLWELNVELSDDDTATFALCAEG